jgi:lysyl oxidase
MGVNLVPSVDGFEIWEEDFRKRGPGAPAGSTIDGSVEDGCVQEGIHKVLRFTLNCKNIGDKPFVIGNPADRTDIFERSTVHRSGWIMRDDFNIYTLKGDKNLEYHGSKRPWCLVGGAPFTCQNQGIAARGGIDRYTSDLACQFIVIDGIADGEYTLEAITNATSVHAAKNYPGKILFEEDNYDDNTISLRLRINGELVDII